MSISIVPYTPEWKRAVDAFHGRLRAGGVPAEMAFPDEPERWGRLYLAAEAGEVRGGYILNEQEFAVSGARRCVAHYRLPLSEGIIDKAYAMTGAQLLRHAMKAQPFLYALGMGGLEKPLPRMLRAMRWGLYAVPFRFRVLRPRRFLREIRPLRQSAARRMAMDAAAWSGAGWLALRLLQRRRPGPSPAEVDTVDRFGGWADEIWNRCAPLYASIAARDSARLNALYPPGRSGLTRLRVGIEGKAAGWAVLLDTRMRADRYFGNLRVGAIVDALAAPEYAPAVIRAAADALERAGVDLVISNQSHRAWWSALRDAAFLEGPSNFVLAVSPAWAQALAPFESRCQEVHINRGDGDGPIHL